MLDREITTGNTAFERVPTGTGGVDYGASADTAGEAAPPERLYPNGAPTYTTTTQVPSEPPWSGTVHPSLAEHLSGDAVKAVQHLIELNIDSVKGWETAADAVDNAPLKGRFREIAEQRRAFAEELQGLVRRAGETPGTGGTVSGAVHRWWMSLRASIGTANTRAVLEEAERGEDVIKHGYEHALKGGGLNGLTRLIADQAVHVRRVHDEVRGLRDQWKAKA